MRRWYPLIRRVTPRRFREFLRNPSSEFQAAAWALQYRVRGAQTLAVRPDWSPRFHPATGVAFRAHQADPLYRDELELFVETCAPGLTMIDVGAHYGVFTLAALHYGGPDARVIAVDPSPKAQHFLELNIALNGVSAQVDRLVTALGATAEAIRVLPTSSGQAFMMVRSPEGRPDATVVATRTLDEVAAASGRRITHIKIDVEGFERQVLEGALRTLASDRPLVQLEVHNDLLRALGDSGERVVDMIREVGYDGLCLDSHGRRASLAEAARGDVSRLFLHPVP